MSRAAAALGNVGDEVGLYDRDCRRRGIDRAARGAPGRPGPPGCAGPAGYWKVMVNVWELRTTVVSPGTRSIWATTVWVPVGGVADSFTLQVEV